MQIREAAERVLFAESLEEKLLLAPESVSDDDTGKSIGLPDGPGRPEELKIVAKGIRGDFPGVHKLDDDHERGRMLHFLANHELLAAELMALVLLKFPDAPKEFRQGVYETMREEQVHTLMYMRRMKSCGIHFGELPVNDYFWRLIAPMDTPMDFVSRLSLTFEQANLDFSKHYAKLFRQVGDTGTAAVLEKIYLDEINHVGHGVKWFRKWKAEGETDWQAFNKSLTFPLAPAKAKGLAPFNAEGRRLAGLDDEFIRNLEVCEQSRGRTPVVHWYNPNAESYAAASHLERRFQPNKMELALEADLELVTLAWCRRDDIVLLRHHPGREHLAYLKQSGFELPEIVEVGQPAGRKLGGIRPWAWSPDASEFLKTYAADVSEKQKWQWREPLPDLWLSKEIGVMLADNLGLTEGVGVFCKDFESVVAAVEHYRGSEDGVGGAEGRGDVLLKAAHSCAGRGHMRVRACDEADSYHAWLRNSLAAHGGVCVEPWLDRVLDFSSLYEIQADGGVSFIGMTEMENDASGRFLGTRVDKKWGSNLDQEVREFLFREVNVNKWYRDTIPSALSKLLTGYTGPVGVDAMVYRKAGGALALRHVVELNVRMTMGRVAKELQKKYAAGESGRLKILRKKNLSEEQVSTLYSRVIHNGENVNNRCVVVNNPETAKAFIVVWETGL